MKNIVKDQLEAAQVAHAGHPSADTLTAFVERTLNSAPRDNVLAHLAVCRACRQAVALATPEAAEVTTAPARAAKLHFPVAMRWASLTAALAVALGVGLLVHERSSTSRTMATASPATQLSASAPIQPTPENVEAKSQPKSEAPERKTLSASVLKKHQNGPLHNLDNKIVNDTSVRTGIFGGVMGGLAGAKGASAMHGNSVAANTFVNTREQSSEAVLAKNPPLTSPASAATPAPSVSGAPGLLQALDTTTVAAPEKNEVISSTQSQPLPPEAARTATQTIAVTPQSETGVAAKTQKRPSAVAIPGSVIGPPLDLNRAVVANWSISDEGQLQRTLRNGVAASVEPAPDVTVEAVAAEGIEVWAAGVPNTASKQPVRPVLFHSSDAGKTWTKIEGPWRSQIVRLSLALGNLTVVAKDGIWSTLNAGKSWLKR